MRKLIASTFASLDGVMQAPGGPQEDPSGGFVVQATGMGPLDYVHHLRLEEAKQMLESGQDSIEAVAFEVGYRDASFFNRLFRRKVMMSPTQYRRRFGGLKSRLREAGSALGGG